MVLLYLQVLLKALWIRAYWAGKCKGSSGKGRALRSTTSTSQASSSRTKMAPPSTTQKSRCLAAGSLAGAQHASHPHEPKLVG